MKPTNFEQTIKTSFDAGYKFTVDMWDGNLSRYKIDDEEIGGLRCFQAFTEARSYAVQQLEKKVASATAALEKTREMKIKDVK